MNGQMVGLISLVKNQQMRAYQQEAMQHSMLIYEGERARIKKEHP
jgi:hypothetical protein